MKCKKRGCQEPIRYNIQQRNKAGEGTTFDHTELCYEHGTAAIIGTIHNTLDTLTEIKLTFDGGRITIKKVKIVQDSDS